MAIKISRVERLIRWLQCGLVGNANLPGKKNDKKQVIQFGIIASSCLGKWLKIRRYRFAKAIPNAKYISYFAVCIF